MGFEIGILFAIGALILWGFGDFFIQRSTRKIGDWETLFIITFFGAIVLTPFIYKDLIKLFSFNDNGFLILLIASFVLFIAALLDFEALKKGKLAIVDSVFALEVPVSVILAFTIIKEKIGLLELSLIVLIVAGLTLISIKSYHLSRRAWIEKGVFLGILGSIFMGASNFFVGFASRITNPLLTNWFINVFIFLMCTIYLIFNKKIKKLYNDVKKNRNLMLNISTFDNAAWVSFAFAASLAPIAIVVALSESYIALAALLGLMINKEKLMKHQKFGLIISLLSAIILAVIYS